MDAMIGMGTLCRQRMSKISSRNPSIAAINNERTEDKYTDS